GHASKTVSLHPPTKVLRRRNPPRRHGNLRRTAGNSITHNKPTISCFNHRRASTDGSRSHPTTYATNTKKRLHATSKHRNQTSIRVSPSGIIPSFKEPNTFVHTRTKTTEL
ncbi:unnamed protein product, partial [Brassica rapa subsp. trilocularis]